MPTPRLLSLLLLAGSLLPLVPASAEAQVITQWNFNSNPPDTSSSTGSITPSTSIAATTSTLSLIGGTTSTFATGSPGDPATTDNTGLNTSAYPSATKNSGTAGVAFAVDTTGFNDIQISLDFRQSGTASRFFQLLVSSDGTTFAAPSGGTASIGITNSPQNSATSFSSTGLYSNNSGSGSQQFVQAITYTLAPGSVYENDPKFAFEWVSVFDPANNTSYTGSNSTYSTSGTARFDEVTISEVPEPGACAASACLGGLILASLVRRGSARRPAPVA